MLNILWAVLASGGSLAMVLIAWGLKSLISATIDNTYQIKKLNDNFNKFEHVPAKVDKHDQDLKVAHDKIRELYQQKLEG